MCGIAGILLPPGSATGENLAGALSRMGNRIVHRGPDSGGSWIDPEAGVALGHRRLAIVDLSPDGGQPMVSACGRYVIVFNGEVYNFREIRVRLESLGHSFRGHSDTEVMLASFTQWGISASLEKFAGMFAFAVWDRKERSLILARDRLGEKPLYYGWMDGVFLFASELKAMQAHPDWNGVVDPGAIALLMRWNYIPSPHSIFKGIRKLPPGTDLVIKGGAVPGSYPPPREYWSARKAMEAGFAEPFSGSDGEALEEFEIRLRRSIGRQMVADVPLGAFLSGGIDSATIAALMQEQTSRPIRTFTIGFHEDGYNEAVHAKMVSNHIGTDHTEVYVGASELLDVVPRLPGIYDEPFSDSSQIPTFLVSQITRKHVTVCLSGDGGDELLMGYSRYRLGNSWLRKVSRLPNPIRKSLGKSIGLVSPSQWEGLFGLLDGVLPARIRQSNVGEKMVKLGEVLSVETLDEIYPHLMSHWKRSGDVVMGAEARDCALSDSSQWPSVGTFSDRMAYLDAVSYLPDDILVKVDRAAMAVSLETRAPFLDHELYEFAWSLPEHMKVRSGLGKWILRECLYKRVPRELIDRPKKGFGVPLRSWLKGPLRDWAESLLDEGRLRREGFLNPAPIRKKWNEHLSGARNWHYHVWDVLMFQAWLENQAATSSQMAVAEIAHG